MHRFAIAALLALVACEHPTEQAAPTPLLLSAIATGYYTTCGLALDSAAYCWGNGRYGQLGFVAQEECSSVPGEDPCAHAPARVDGSFRFVDIAAGGAHMCALTSLGEVYCWGDDRFGQLGTLDTAAVCGLPLAPCARTPRPSYLPPPATSVSAGDSHTCAVVEASYCWGYGAGGRLGTGSDANAQDPAIVAAGMKFRSIVAGGASTCGIARSDEMTYCWGGNHLGQLGDGSRMSHSLPQRIADPLRFVSLTVGTAHACGITTEGDAYCWGGAGAGELGGAADAVECGGYACRTTPGLVAGGHRFRTIAAGHAFTCGTTATASYCWGGIPGAVSSSPVPVAFGRDGAQAGTPFVRFAAGFGHACGITASREAYCWGADYHGVLGDGPLESPGDQPVLVIAPDSTSRHALGRQH